MDSATAKRSPGRPRVEKPSHPILTVRGSEEWRDWVHRLRDHARLKSAGDLIDAALVEHAKRLGFNETPPKR